MVIKNVWKLQTVTILILVDGFLQLGIAAIKNFINNSHNPYFSRWFSAILITTG